MLYLIDGKYYMLRTREYVKVDVDLIDGELNIKPDRTHVIEANDGVKATGVLIDDVIKGLKKPSPSNYEYNKHDR